MFGNSNKIQKRAEINKIDPMERLRASVQSALSKRGNQDPTQGLQFLQAPEKPEFDTETQGRYQDLMKKNAIGKAIGSLFQLAGVASGGDAINTGNTTGALALQGLQNLDIDHKERLRDYSDRLFRTNAFNADLQNREFQDERQYGRQLEGNKRQERLAEERAMIEMGIDPSQPGAKSEFLQKRQQLFEMEKKNTQSLINARNQAKGPGKGEGVDQSFTQNVMRGRQIKLAEINKQIEALRKDGEIVNESQIESLQKEKDQIKNSKIDPKSTLAQALAQLGAQGENDSKEDNSNIFQGMHAGASSPQKTNQKTTGQTTNGKTPSTSDYLSPNYKEQDLSQHNQRIEQMRGASREQLIIQLQQEPNDVAAKSLLADILIKQGYAKTKDQAFKIIDQRIKK